MQADRAGSPRMKFRYGIESALPGRAGQAVQNMVGREDQGGQVGKGGMDGLGRAGQSARKGRPGR